MGRGLGGGGGEGQRPGEEEMEKMEMRVLRVLMIEEDIVSTAPRLPPPQQTYL
jgi:hypothetical protein